MALRDSSAIKFGIDEIAFIQALFHWLKPLTEAGGEKTGVPGENPLMAVGCSLFVGWLFA